MLNFQTHPHVPFHTSFGKKKTQNRFVLRNNLWRAFFLTKTMTHISYSHDFGPGGANWRSWTTPPHRATGKHDMYDDFILQSNNHVNFPFSEVNQVILGNNKRELAIASAPDSCTSDIQVTVLLLVGCFTYIYVYIYMDSSPMKYPHRIPIMIGFLRQSCRPLRCSNGWLPVCCANPVMLTWL